MRFALASLLGSILLASAAHAQEHRIVIVPLFAQQVIIAPPDDWEIAYLYEDHATSLAKFTRRDESLFDWHEILAIEAYQNTSARSRYGPETMLKAIQEEYAGHCATPLSVENPGPFFVNGYPAASLLLNCTALGEEFDGVPEAEASSSLLLSIRGLEDFYVIRYTIRAASADPGTSRAPPISRDNFRDYLQLFGPILLCNIGDTPADCLDHRAQPDSLPQR